MSHKKQHRIKMIKGKICSRLQFMPLEMTEDAFYKKKLK